MREHDARTLLTTELDRLVEARLDTAFGDVGDVLRHVLDAEIGEVHRALDRLDAGTYGRCEACGDPIDEARLRAVPATRLCFDDQCGAEAEEEALLWAVEHGPTEREACKHLDLLPVDDDEVPPVEAAEEEAMHVVLGR